MREVWHCPQCGMEIRRFEHDGRRDCPKCGTKMQPFVVEDGERRELRKLED